MVWTSGQSGNPSGRPKGSVNRQLQQIRAACDVVLPLVLARALGGDFEAQKFILERGLPKLKPVELPVEFSLGEGEAAPVRAIIQQAAAGELSLSQAEKLVYDLMPAVAQEEKALAWKAPTYGGFGAAYLRSVGRAPAPKGDDNAEVLALMAEIAGPVK